MPEFDRTANIQDELRSLDDDTTAQLAEITFTSQDDQGTCRLLRESIAEEYRNGHAERRDRWWVAGTVGEDVAGRGDRMARFASVYDIEAMPIIIDIEHAGGLSAVSVSAGQTIGDVVCRALAVRLTHAAYQLMTYLEDHADSKEGEHEDTDDTDDGSTRITGMRVGGTM
jgi:hypothetical protein